MLLSGTVAVKIIAVRVITFMIHLGCSSNGIDTVTTPIVYMMVVSFRMSLTFF
jgi:hypothetical protein